MKFLLLSLIVPISLVARLNPFEPIEAPVPQMETLKPIPVHNVTSKDDGNRTIKIISEEKIKSVIPKVVIKEKIVSDINKTKLEVKAKPKPKPKPQFKARTFKLLPFLRVDSKKKYMTIKTRYKYKLIRYIDDKENKKFIFDFKGKVISSTKHRKIMYNPYFKGFRVGNHPKEKFFRVVIDTKKNTSKYRVSVKNNVVTLSYK
jgi:hypothetical protein